MAFGQLPHLGLELLLGFVAHASGAKREVKPQEVVPFPVGRPLRFLGTQLKSELALESLLDENQGLLRLLRISAEHHEVLGVPREARAGLMELPVQPVEHDIREEG